MRILAVEFSSAQRSVAVLRAGGHGVSISEVVEAGTAGVFEMSEQALRQCGLEREQIERIGIGLGPGSYTGIRAALALAQGWHLAIGVKVLGVSSVECLAAQAHAENFRGKVAIVVDAQRNEFYLANYELDAAGYRETRSLRLASLDEVKSCENAGEPILGPGLGRWFPKAVLLLPSAATVARLALAREPSVLPQQLEPIYLRETQFVKATQPKFSAG